MHLFAKKNWLNKATSAVVLTAIGFALGSVFVGQVQSQQIDPAEIIYQKEDFSVEIETTTETYRGQLAEYRQAEQEFVVAKGQYAQVETLSALNALIDATQTVYQKRIQVLETYFTLLQLQLQSVEGVNLVSREQAIGLLGELQQEFDNQKTILAQNQTANSLLDYELRFIETAELVPIASDYINQLIQVAQLQNGYDDTVALKTRIRTSLVGDDEPSLAWQRAEEQLDALLEDTNQQLRTIATELEQDPTRNSGSRRLRDFTTIHSQLLQAVTYLEELVQFN